ncbi:uncharacterized protein [Clytia hemisphaerica]|uniref:uncharacterized protein n=1 Tax=Clytia hemisphaerica TaxID=252671 RepID=UPI0034D3997A
MSDVMSNNYPEVHKVILLNAAKDDNEERNEDDDIIDPPTDGDNDEDEDDDEDDDDEDDQMSYCTKDDDCVYGKTISELLNQVGKPNRMLGSKVYVNVTIPDGCYLETRIAPTTGKKKANEDVCEIPVPSIRGEITKTMTEMLNIFEKKQRDIKLKCDDDEDDDDDDDDDKEDKTIKDDGTNKSAQRKSYLMTYGSPEFVASNPNFDAPNLMVEDAYTKAYHKSTNHHPFHPRRKHQQNAQI